MKKPKPEPKENKKEHNRIRTQNPESNPKPQLSIHTQTLKPIPNRNPEALIPKYSTPETITTLIPQKVTH